MNAANFQQSINGKPVALFHIFTQEISCFITNYGARIVSLETFDKEDKMVDVVLGFDNLDDYIHAKSQYHGATVGRYANRIANGTFTINDSTFSLVKNKGNNSLHGGINAFHNQVWDCVSHTQNEIVLEFISPHLEEGFPGELKTRVTFTVDGSNVSIDYEAISTEDTIINLTNHAYFNLNGEGSGTVLDHKIFINAEYFTPVDNNSIPLGHLQLVSETPFDFTREKAIGIDIDEENEQLKIGKGYDHNFVLNQYVEKKLNLAARAWGDKSNIKMEVWTTEPGVQFFTANNLDGSDKGKSGVDYTKRMAFCLETQHFPDSPNQAHFPSTLLRAEQKFQSSTVFRFSTA
jgi:aldose 1-epimerase